jgi:hypothetical protein
MLPHGEKHVGRSSWGMFMAWSQESECLKLEMRAESERQGDWASWINLMK